MFDQTATSLPSQRLGHAVCSLLPAACLPACHRSSAAHTCSVEWKSGGCALRMKQSARQREITIIRCRNRLIIFQIFVVLYEELGTSLLAPRRAQMSEIRRAFTLKVKIENFRFSYFLHRSNKKIGFRFKFD